MADPWDFVRAACRSPTMDMLGALAKEDMDMNSTFNVNFVCEKNPTGKTPLQIACQMGEPRIVAFLLKQTDAHPNYRDMEGATPLLTVFYNSYHRQRECFKALLSDPRCNLKNVDGDGTHIIQLCLDTIESDECLKCVIALRGHKLKVNTPIQPDNEPATDLSGCDLLDEFEAAPLATQFRMKICIGEEEAIPAYAFACTVFISDDFLKIRHRQFTRATHGASEAARFFQIACKLPLELQMLLCNRIVRSNRDLVPRFESEVAFKQLARESLA